MNIQTVIFDYDGTLVWLNINFDHIRQEIEQLFLVGYDIDFKALKGLYVLEMIDEVTKSISKTNPHEGPAFLPLRRLRLLLSMRSWQRKKAKSYQE